MTFSKPRFNHDYAYELVRFCSKLNTQVIGGASRLLKYFRTKNPNKSILSYADRRWSTGNLYKQLGFSLSHYSSPNYRYYKGKHSMSRYSCQKHNLKGLFPKFYDASLSEKQIMIKAGYNCVYDSGNSVWVIK